MQSSEYLVKYHRLTKNVRFLSQFFTYFTLLIFIVILVLGFISMGGGLPDVFYQNLALSLDGVLRFDLCALEIDMSTRHTVLSSMLFSLVAFCIIYGLILYNLTAMLKTVEKGTPFVHSNVRRLQAVAYILLIGSFVVGIAYAAMSEVIVTALQLQAVSVNYQMNSSMFAAGLIILILAGVFRYGVYLQEEYDSTL